MLQTEKSQEAGFFSNSYVTMDLEVLKKEFEDESKMKVGLQFKAACRDKIAVDAEDKSVIRAIHVELEAENFNTNFKKCVSICSNSSTGFKHGRRIRFWSHPDLVKSDKSKGTLTKACEHQKLFISAVMQEHDSSTLFLDAIPEGSSLPSMRELTLDIKSSKFPSIPLFHSIDRTWNRMICRREFVRLFIPHLAEEEELMIHNLIPYLRHKYGDDMLLYFEE